MANPPGILNGTNYLLIKAINGTGEQMVIGGFTSNSTNYNRDVIDVTNKSSEQYRTLLTGDEGTKSAEHNGEVFFSSDAAFQEVRSDWLTGNIGDYILQFDEDTAQDFRFKVTNFTDNVELNAGVATSITFTSSDEFDAKLEYANYVVTDNGGSNYVVTDNGGSNYLVGL